MHAWTKSYRQENRIIDSATSSDLPHDFSVQRSPDTEGSREWLCEFKTEPVCVKGRKDKTQMEGTAQCYYCSSPPSQLLSGSSLTFRRRICFVVSYLALGMLCQQPLAVSSVVVSRLLALACRTSIWSMVAAAHPLPLNDSLFHRARSVSSPPEPSIRQYQNSSHCRRCLRESPSFPPRTIQGSILFSPCGRVEVGNPFSSGWAASKAV